MLIARISGPKPGSASRRLSRLFGSTGDTVQANPEVGDVAGTADNLCTPDTAPPLAVNGPDEPGQEAAGLLGDADGQVDPKQVAGSGTDALADTSTAQPVGVGRTGAASQIVEAFGLTGARLEPGRSAVRALAVVAGVVVLLAGAVAWWSQPRPEPVAVPAPAATSQPQASASGVVVAVAGKVRRPGLVTVPAGARVADAIDAAGGLLPDTDVGLLNLARKVSDGELIVVGASPPPGAAPGGAGTPGDPQAKVNLNTATSQQLDTLPGVGPVLAQRILEHRDKHSGFRSVRDLQRVDGIGPARYEQLKELVTV